MRPETLAAIQETFACGWSSEKEVAGEIRARYEKDGYLCDTHTAVAFHVAAQKKRSGSAHGGVVHRIAFQVPAQRAGGSGPHRTGK